MAYGEIARSNGIEYENNIIKIQKWYRGCIFRLKRLPLIMYKIRIYLIQEQFQFSQKNEDGRINSCIDSDEIINILIQMFGSRIKKPKIRMWYDFLVFDYLYGWIPINIKTTTTKTNDNTGNLTMCVYSYTNELLNLHSKYNNGEMSNILFNKLKDKMYNYSNKKDYYFLVLNKNDKKVLIEIINKFFNKKFYFYIFSSYLL